MVSLSDFELVCQGVEPRNVEPDGQPVQAFGTITNNANERETVSISVYAYGPAYPPNSPFAGQENKQRLDTVNTVVGANRSETWQTEPESIKLGTSRPEGEYEVRAELSIV